MERFFPNHANIVIFEKQKPFFNKNYDYFPSSVRLSVSPMSAKRCLQKNAITATLVE